MKPDYRTIEAVLASTPEAALLRLGGWLTSRKSWITVEKVEAPAGSWSIVIKIDGFYSEESGAEDMRQLHEDELNEWGIVQGRSWR